MIEGALRAMELEHARTSSEIGINWERIVGPEVARHCRPVGVKNGVLVAEVDSSVWCQQLQLRTPEILESLREFLGEQSPTAVRFRVGYNRTP